jgi:hypothetical protein
VELHFEADYDTMQSALNTTLQILNTGITSMNNSTNYVIPFLHSDTNINSGKGRVRYAYTKFADGVHPTSFLAGKWDIQITKLSVPTNQSTSQSQESEEEDEKRSWEYKQS